MELAVIDFTVCAKSKVKKTCKSFSATHLISTLDPGDRVFRPPSIDGKNHLQLWFEDEEDASKWSAPTIDHAQSILDFGSRIPDNSRVVVHCFAGICRSTSVAIALKLFSDKNFPLSSVEEWINSIRPNAVPNLLLAKHFDEILNFSGSLVGVCKQIGDNNTKKNFDLWEDHFEVSLKT
jgi:predicted protein tyrosine phosphatase